MKRIVSWALFGLSLSLLAPWAAAQSPWRVQGPTLGGAAFDSATQRGKVLMVFHWSTDCAVCRSKLPELRANAQGWRGKPFELVLVSEDRRRADALAYDEAWRATQKADLHPPSLWAGEPGFADSSKVRPRQLPLTIVLDAQGIERARFEGRIPPEAWDAVAELLP
ncbi:TlpA disulfide reductase family protein [Variovorax sp. YR752]|uniref:TlpA family protein disulfide reductase n=1 Tax=Variovorax sp. YR752 TaxID=1884383 RepID=UPI003137A10A